MEEVFEKLLSIQFPTDSDDSKEKQEFIDGFNVELNKIEKEERTRFVKILVGYFKRQRVLKDDSDYWREMDFKIDYLEGEINILSASEESFDKPNTKAKKQLSGIKNWDVNTRLYFLKQMEIKKLPFLDGIQQGDFETIIANFILCNPDTVRKFFNGHVKLKSETKEQVDQYIKSIKKGA